MIVCGPLLILDDCPVVAAESMNRKNVVERVESEGAVRLWLSVMIVGLFLAPSEPAAQERILVLEGGTLIDGTGRPPLRTLSSLSKGRGSKPWDERTGQYPSNATVISLNGRTVLPGLIDGHVHLSEWQLPMFLPYGVTTIADIHNDTAWSIAQREALKSGKIIGPRLFVSGARVTGPLGPPTTDGSYVRDVAEARAYVRSLARRASITSRSTSRSLTTNCEP